MKPTVAPPKWPKQLPPLTPEQAKISDDFMKLWLGELSHRKRYGPLEDFNQSFAIRKSPQHFEKTLEIGAGLGEHLAYEKLSPEQEASYYANDLRENMVTELRRAYPRVQVINGDCQQRFDFPEGFFDRIIAIHVFEHLPNLPAAIREAYRLINKSNGNLFVVIPCEGSLAYSLARKISAERVYKRHFGGDYSWFYKREHINLPHEVFEELHPYFEIRTRDFYPLRLIPFVWANLVIGLHLKPRPTPLL